MKIQIGKTYRFGLGGTPSSVVTLIESVTFGSNNTPAFKAISNTWEGIGIVLLSELFPLVPRGPHGRFAKTAKPSTKKLAAFLALAPLGQWKAFLKYVKTRPKNLEYNYMDTLNCPKAQFGKHLIHGSRRLKVSCGSEINFRFKTNDEVMAWGLEGTDFGNNTSDLERVINSHESNTFGALATRLEKLLS